MVKSAAEFTHRNTERAVQATSQGMDWLREIADQNISQTKVAAETMLLATRKAVDALGEQGSAFHKHYLTAAEAMLSNTFDFLHKLTQMKEPHELAHIQSEFVSRQAQIIGDQAKELGQTMVQETREMTRTTVGGPKSEVA
jgi:hypothetical protein